MLSLFGTATLQLLLAKRVQLQVLKVETNPRSRPYLEDFLGAPQGVLQLSLLQEKTWSWTQLLIRGENKTQHELLPSTLDSLRSFLCPQRNRTAADGLLPRAPPPSMDAGGEQDEIPPPSNPAITSILH
jgi:hypothetical protein